MLSMFRGFGALFLLVAAGACGPSNSVRNDGGGNGADAPPTGNLVISPRDVTLTIVDGAIVDQFFTATLNGNQDVTASVAWSFDLPEIGILPTPGRFLPSGTHGGVGTLRARFGTIEDTTSITVIIRKTVDPNGLAGQFGNPIGNDPSLAILYPYDQTVFPLNVASQEMMWNGGGAADVYRLHMSELYYDYTIYFSAPPPSRHLINATEWRQLTESGQGAQSDPLSVSLQRSASGTTYNPVTQTWHVAKAPLPGTVYYWELPDQCGTGNGRVLSVSPADSVVTQFYSTGECYGCHSVSRDGRTLATSFSTGTPFPIQTLDVSQSPAVLGNITTARGLTGTFSAFNHDGRYLVYSNNSSSGPTAPSSALVIADATTGTVVNGNAMGVGCGEPAWSPDGLHIAASCGYTNGGWTFDATTGYLAIGDVQGDGFTVANTRSIVPQAAGPGRPAYPSFSTDSEYIVYGRPTSGSRSNGNGTLWITRIDGSENRALSIAASSNVDFNPTFAPIRAGGFYWLAFMSRRDYGNRLVGANRQQLWITAISDPPSATDPSHPAFYLRGQEDCAKSENAYFAPEPCISDLNMPCETGIDCCSGHCIFDQNTQTRLCGERGACSEDGNGCNITADCCNPGANCIDGFCQTIVQ